MLRIAYLFHLDAGSPSVQSGRPASILRQLSALGAKVYPVFPLKARISRRSTVKKALYRLTGRYYRGDREPSYLSQVASEFKRRTDGEAYDMVFSPGSEAVSRLEVPQPIAFCADATFANMIDYYWDFSSLSAEYVRKGHQQEREALHRASLAVYPSEWAARSAIEFYDTDPGKVAIIPFGANLGSENRRDMVHARVAARHFDEIRILFVGKAWNRKGGDIVVESALRLVSMGMRVRLDLVSAAIPDRVRRIPWVACHGFLNPADPAKAAELGDLFSAAHVVFIPSRAEAYGMAFAEASAFGVPAIGTDTGGIPSVVRNGVNGFTLPLSAEPSDFADLIARMLSRREDYFALCRSSFEEFEQRLNWRTFATRFLELSRKCCGELEPKTEGCA